MKQYLDLKVQLTCVIALLISSGNSFSQTTSVYKNTPGTVTKELSSQIDYLRNLEKTKSNLDSTKIAQGAGTASVCRTLDGIPIDGSAGTPSAAPYNKGQRYKSIEEVRAAFGGRPILLNSGACLTDCATNTTWNGTSCAPTVCSFVFNHIDYGSCKKLGLTGTMQRDVFVDCNGVPQYGSWDTSTCEATLPTCPDTVVTTESCGSGFTGTKTTTTTYSGSSCTPKTTTSGCTPLSACPEDVSISGSCGPGYTGFTLVWTIYKAPTCTTKTVVDRQYCTEIIASCPSSTTTTGSCGAGFTGSTVITTTYSGPSCTPTKSDPDRAGCTPIATPCKSPTTATFTPNCPANYSPSSLGTKITTYDCTSGSPVGTTIVSDPGACVENPPTCIPSSESIACGSGYNGGTKTRYSSCATKWSSATWGAYDTSSCIACPADTYGTFTPNCPAGYNASPNSGQTTTHFNCASGSAIGSPKVTYAGDCIATTPTCSSSDVSTIGARVGSPCSYKTKTTCTDGTTTINSSPGTTVGSGGVGANCNGQCYCSQN